MIRREILLLLLLFGTLSAQEATDRKVEFIPLSTNVYIHRTYMPTQDFGLVGCNGLVYVVSGKALVIDTPHDVNLAKRLLERIREDLGAEVTGVVIGHSHVDSMGGLAYFQQLGIPSYGNEKTQDLARKQGLPVPSQGYQSELELMLGGRSVRCAYLGAGHTQDNSVTYLVQEKILFGGCLVKADGAGRGYLGDADVAAWSDTVEKIMARFPVVKTVVPGHGDAGDRHLLEYTLNMFREF